MSNETKKKICMGLAVVPVLIGAGLAVKGSSTEFGADFYTDIFEAVYAGFAWLCIALGLISESIIIALFCKSTDDSVTPEKTDNNHPTDATASSTVLKDPSKEVVVEVSERDNKASQTTSMMPSEDNYSSNIPSVVDELKHYKQLLDEEKITQDEFNNKKKRATRTLINIGSIYKIDPIF